ncbi:MAG: 2-oxo acid dehydrogenase subunit E2 [Planctomycetota bacterium]|nr:2-oxo acid dehydrogenase subunit E2 [Planctomycetota bacterium]
MPFGWRPDGDVVQNVPATRRIMPFIMRSRNESAVYFEQHVDMAKAQAFIQKTRDESGAKVTLLHLVIWALGQVLEKRPRLNRFTAGGRIYQRRGIWASFSAKKGKSDDHPIVVIKKQIRPEMSFIELVTGVLESVKEGKSDKKSSTDKELAFFLSWPVFLLSWFIGFAMKLDQWGFLPGFFIRDDPMFASVFIANLGSLKMDAGYHHLYEYGNIPIFITLGQIKAENFIQDDGSVGKRSIMTVRYSFDERIEDGLYCLQSLAQFQDILEDPEKAMNSEA